MNVNAANALLKVLEEPPANTTLLLICHQPSRILPTIRSRCRTLRLSELSAELIQQALDQAHIDLDPTQTRVTTALSAGSVGDAIRMSSTHGAQVYLGLLGLIGQAPRMDREKVLSFANAYAGKSASDEFETMIGMVEILITRLARSGATGQPPVKTVSDQEFDIFQKLCPTPALARKWADLNHELSSRLRHGRAVNLDPVSMILDTLFKIEDCAARA
jgi:DNA polymerase-3 subunit delta'